MSLPLLLKCFENGLGARCFYCNPWSLLLNSIVGEVQGIMREFLIIMTDSHLTLLLCLIHKLLTTNLVYLN